MSNAILTGQDPAAPFLAYGDKSRVGERLVYAFAVLRREHRELAERRLDQVRNQFAIPDDTQLHCRVLAGGEARAKHGLAHLSERNVRELLSVLVDRMYPIPVQCTFAHVELPNREPLVDSSDADYRLPNEPKGVLGLLMQACFAVPPDGSKGPPPSQTQIFVSADPTKIRFLGPGRYQAHRGYSGFSDVGDGPAGHVLSIEPVAVRSDGWKQHPLLQVADVFAYVCAHVARDDFYAGLLKRMRWSRAALVLAERTEPNRVTGPPRELADKGPLYRVFSVRKQRED